MIRLLKCLPTLAAIGLAAASTEVGAQTAVPIEVNDGGYLYVHARIGNGREVKLLLDTGAGINTLSEAIITGLGSQARSAGVHTGTRHNGEKITGEIWTIPSLSLGALTKRDVVVGKFAPEGADGLLSMDFFRDQPFTVNFVDRSLTLESPARVREIADKAEAIPIELKPNGPNELDLFVRVCTGADVSALAEFDTGAGYNMLMLQPSYMSRLKISPGGPGGDFGYYVYSTVLPEVHFCAAPSVGARHQFVGFKEGLIYEGLIGHGAFRDRRLTIDIPGRRMLVW